MKVGEDVRYRGGGGGGGGGGRQDSRRRFDPAYTPDIAHLVHRGSSLSAEHEAKAKSARARLAEVLSLTRTASRLRQATQRKQAVSTGSVDRYTSGYQQSSLPSSKSTERSTMPSSRGSNVSVLHLRSASEPWEVKSSVYTTPNSYNHYNSNYVSGSNYANRASLQRGALSRDFSREGSLNVEQNTRELSPVRWCDREVDGVFLGRSGWVQVQQSSIDRRDPTQTTVTTTGNRQHVTRIKMADLHSKSEPGKMEPPHQRPGYLPLPGATSRRGRASPSSLDLTRDERITPPPPTPIISPPPAFQDAKYRGISTRPRIGPTLFRSNAIEISPPPSPPKFRLSPNTHQGPPSRRRLTPSPVNYQAKSFEEQTLGRRHLYQKKDSSSSSSSSFGFHSLDSSLNPPRPHLMPRLNETDSSVGGYEEGDDMSDYSTVTLVPRESPDIERVSPSGRSRQRQRRSPGSDIKNGSPCSSSSSSTELETFRRGGSSHNRAHGRRIIQQHSATTPLQQQQVQQQQQQQQQIQLQQQLAQQAYELEKANRVRRSRSLQLPERCSPGHPTYVGQTQLMPGQAHTRQPRPMHSRVQSDELAIDAELRREAEEEARVVTEFVQGVRSREAARSLLRHRYLQEREDIAQHAPPSGPPSVVLVRPGAQTRARGLQRGITAPSGWGGTTTPVNYCAHSSSTISAPNMRLSQSYPAQRPNKEYNTRSSPASLERVNDASPRPRRGNSLNVPTQEELDAGRRHRFRRSPDRYEECVYRRENVPVTVHKAPDIDTALSPKISPVNSLISNSSSSSEMWLTCSERTRSPRLMKSAASTPEDRKWTEDSRPGSAPAEQRTGQSGRVEHTQRSLSLPKCFQTGRELPRLPPTTHHNPQRLQYK